MQNDEDSAHSVSDVFVLMHAYEHDECEEMKFIGVYRSRTEAEATASRLRLQPGFRDYPDGFQIDRYPLDQDYWAEGFRSD
jgi:hypothetical protein